MADLRDDESSSNSGDDDFEEAYAPSGGLGNESGLLVNSTISRDGTSSDKLKQQNLLSQLNVQLSGRGQRRSTNIPGSAMPVTTPPVPPGWMAAGSGLRPVSQVRTMGQSRPMGGPRTMGHSSHAGQYRGPYPYPPAYDPRQRSMPGGSMPFRPPPPNYLPPGYRNQAPGLTATYPSRKVTKDAQWRHKSGKNGRGVSSDHDEKKRGLTTVHHSSSPFDARTTTAKTAESAEKVGGNVELPLTESSRNATTDPEISISNGNFVSTNRRLGPTLDDIVRAPGDVQSLSNGTNADNEISSLGLAETLNAVAENYLKMDTLDQTQETTRFISYLLDTIHLLEGQVRYYQAADDDSITESECDSEAEKSQEDVGELIGPIIPRGQVLHRVYCTSNNHHSHNESLYEDVPAFDSAAFDGSGGLFGQMKIDKLSTYLLRNPHIYFIIFKEYDCATGQQGSSRLKKDTKNASSRLLSPRAERMRIVSPILQGVLEQVAEFQIYGSDENDDDDEEYRANEMDAPYLFLFHHRDKLSALPNGISSKEAVKPLLEFLGENYSEEYMEAQDLFSKGLVTVKHISKLFKPNQTVISHESTDALKAYVLDDYALLKRESIRFFGWSWLYNGRDLQRKDWDRKIRSLPEGEIQISNLPVHPFDYAQSGDLAKLDARGKKFWEMKGQYYTCYTGWDRSHNYYYINARFMVDVATYHIMHSGPGAVRRNGDTPRKFDTWPTKIDRTADLTPELRVLLPAITYGFNLHEKKWVTLHVEEFHPMNWNKKAFERLVLDAKIKEMIYALVDVQTTTKKMDDIITGKGNGLIILLHGSPGTGKTLTAESVAEIAEKPLYRVTCGDIGTNAADVEKYLQSVMYLGKIWDCVLLLDEADVFLEERTMADLQRNSLVSVFLRILEYYEGILILTSNRVGTFDEAFKSRIQVAIHYDNLTKKSRKAIWRNFFDMIEDSADEDANMPELERRLDELAAEEMNGRQIRNALLTARQLAKHRKERLDWQHLSQVIKTSAAFNKYLKVVRGHSDDQWAREEMLR